MAWCFFLSFCFFCCCFGGDWEEEGSQYLCMSEFLGLFCFTLFFNLCHQSRYIWLSQSKITAVCKSLCGGETRDWSKQNFSRMLNKYKCSISTNKWYKIDENKCAKVKAYLLWLEKIWVISVLERDQ